MADPYNTHLLTTSSFTDFFIMKIQKLMFRLCKLDGFYTSLIDQIQSKINVWINSYLYYYCRL